MIYVDTNGGFCAEGVDEFVIFKQVNLIIFLSLNFEFVIFQQAQIMSNESLMQLSRVQIAKLSLNCAFIATSDPYVTRFEPSKISQFQNLSSVK